MCFQGCKSNLVRSLLGLCHVVLQRNGISGSSMHMARQAWALSVGTRFQNRLVMGTTTPLSRTARFSSGDRASKIDGYRTVFLTNETAELRRAAERASRCSL